MRFEYLDEVWSQDPVFFHGRVVGYFRPIGQEKLVWICQSQGGNTLFVPDDKLFLARKQQSLKVEGKIKQ